ncbi:MAG: AAA family ATPase, partial [Verrucomicrobiota bacterium]
MSKKIPYAVANYEKIVDGGYYFVDKTRFIRELELYEAPVHLRPRRFGKSLWCSILECYYDVNRRDRFVELFGHTDIGREPTDQHSSHLVMRFDFSKIEVLPDYQLLKAKFNSECRNSFSRFFAS